MRELESQVRAEYSESWPEFKHRVVEVLSTSLNSHNFENLSDVALGTNVNEQGNVLRFYKCLGSFADLVSHTDSLPEVIATREK